MYIPLALEQLKPCREMGFSRLFRLVQKNASSSYCRSRSIPPVLSHKTPFYPCRAIIPRAFFSANADIQTAEANDPKLGFVVSHTQNLQSHKTKHTASEHPEEEEEDDVPEEARGAGSDSKLEIQHPWPEWISLMERLVENNYFESLAPSDEDEEVSSTSDMFKDVNLVKAACLKFGRDRFDILRSLSREDIKAVLEYGCLNTNRKVVNSGKRLRVYVNLDEGVVCSICNLRGSCDRACIKPHQEEGARMDDIMRVLLAYGLDALVGSAENELHMRETVIASVRKLLKAVVELSATPLDPNLPRPVPKQPLPKIKELPPLPTKRPGITDVEMKKGDWLCQRCNIIIFARNTRCIKCDERRPKEQLNPGEWECPAITDVEMKKGDWLCPRCNIIIFARNTRCIKCDERRPKEQLNPGDWECPACDFINFIRNMTCLKCGCKHPKDDHMQNARHGLSDFQQLQKLQNPGDWECPACKFNNFRRNVACLKCGCKHPKDEDKHSSRQGWNDYRTNAMGDFQQSKHLEHKLKNPVKAANTLKARNDEYDHGSTSDDDLLNSARKNKDLGITDGNFDFDDISVHEGKIRTTVGQKKEENAKKTFSRWDLGVDKRSPSSSAKANHFSDLYLDDDDDDNDDAVDSDWNKAPGGRVSERYGRDSTSAREKGRAHNYDDTDDEDGFFGSDQKKESGSCERSSFSKPTGEKKSFKNSGDLDEDDDDDDDDGDFESEDDQPQASRSKLRGEKARSSGRGEHRVQSRRMKDPSAFGVRGSDANDHDIDELDDLFGSEDEQAKASRSKLRGGKARSSGRREQ